MASKEFNKRTKRFDPNRTRTSVARSKHRQFRWWWWPVIALGVTVAGLIISHVMAKRDVGIANRQAVVKRNVGVLDGQGVNLDAVPLKSLSGDTAWDPSWPSLPASGESARPIEVVRAMYAYAARQGHRSNRDCFVKSKTPAGVPQWDGMGYT